MNVPSVHSADLLQGDDVGSDSDSNPDQPLEYYQPISAVDEEGGGVNSDDEHHSHAGGYHFEGLDNGYCAHGTGNGIASIRLEDDAEAKSSDGEEEEEEERRREASDSAILRAIREDETRRNAPLPPENATRVMEAMRGISFGGLAPDWAGRVTEDQWVNQLRRLRQN